MKQGPLRRWKRVRLTEKLERNHYLHLNVKREKVKMELTIGFGHERQKQKLLCYVS